MSLPSWKVSEESLGWGETKHCVRLAMKNVLSQVIDYIIKCRYNELDFVNFQLSMETKGLFYVKVEKFV